MSEENYMYIDQWKIYYRIFGNGPHVVLFSAGALGSSIETCVNQYKNFDLDAFTLVLWDKPGVGRSRPPNREFTVNLFSEDADYAYRLMKALNYERYSLCGMCDGGALSIILAANHPEAVRGLIVVNTKPQVQQSDVDKISNYRDTDKWNQIILAQLHAIYGRDGFASMWSSYNDLYDQLIEFKDGNICLDHLKDITCPTLIFGSTRDPLVDAKHSLYLHEHIKGSELYMHEGAEHSMFYSHPEMFNSKVQDFLRRL